MAGVEIPNFDILGPYGPRKLPKPFPKDMPQEELLKLYYAQFADANWWNWDQPTWETYLAYNQAQRNEQGESYEEHMFERILLEFGRWSVSHSDADVEQKF